MAYMMFTAMTPLVAFLALRMSSCSSGTGMPEPPMVPIPPHSATGTARAEVDTRIDIPPWMIGIFAISEPIFNSGSFIDLSSVLWGVETVSGKASRARDTGRLRCKTMPRHRMFVKHAGRFFVTGRNGQSNREILP